MFKVKVSGIYKIEHKSGYYYIGQSVDIGNRWNSHITDLYLKKHSSVKFQELWNKTDICDWQFKVERIVSKTNLKATLNLKGKEFEKQLRKQLLKEEKEIMSNYFKENALNKQNRYFRNNI